MTKEPTLGEFEIKFEAHEQRDIDRFETTLDKMTRGFASIVSKLDEIKEDLTKQVSDHETRLRALESDMIRVMTWGSVALIALGILETGITIIVKYVF